MIPNQFPDMAEGNICGKPGNPNSLVARHQVSSLDLPIKQTQ